MPKHLNDVRPGDLFAGRYLIESILADGGFGRVFRARHQLTGQLRAVKALMPAAVAHPHVRKRFNAEARVAARIGSPHVVEVSDTSIDGETGAPYLAMEFLDGETLDAKVERDGPLSRSETAAVSAELWALCGQCSLQMGAWADAAREYSEAIGRELLPVHVRGRAAAWRGLGQYAHAAADETLADALDDAADSASDRQQYPG